LKTLEFIGLIWQNNIHRRLIVDTVIENTIRKYKLIKNELDTVKGSIGLIYPKNRSSDIRISEQELKVLFCAELININKIFSVETPTVGKYSFTGKNSESGNIDVCIYDFKDKKYLRTNNIEFKAHNKNYKSDFEKLIGEEGDNYFIHVLPSINNGTLFSDKSSKRKPVINKYIEQIDAIYTCAGKPNKYKTLTFYICILDPFILLKNIINKEHDGCISKIKSKLELNYSIRKNIFNFDKKNWIEIKI
jgi:hypothetical protein